MGKIRNWIFVNPIKIALTIEERCNRILFVAVYLRGKEVRGVEKMQMEL